MHRAAALEQRDGAVQVDLGRRREHGRGLRVVAGALERVEAPELDALHLEIRFGDVDDRHGLSLLPTSVLVRVFAGTPSPVVQFYASQVWELGYPGEGGVNPGR